MIDNENRLIEETQADHKDNRLKKTWLGLGRFSQFSVIVITSTATTLVVDLVITNVSEGIEWYTKIVLRYIEENLFIFTERSMIDFFAFIASFLGLSLYSSSLKKNVALKQLIRRNEVLEEMVLEDGLTKLLNRRGVQKMLYSLCSRARRRKGEVHILFIDLDNLKYINSRFGHALGGDVAIARVAQAIQETFRDEDTSGRYGGDEFVGIFIYPSIDAENMERTKVVRERLQEAVSKIHAMAIPISDPSVGYEEIPVGVTTAIHIVNLENQIDVELNEASEKMLKLKEEKKKKN